MNTTLATRDVLCLAGIPIDEVTLTDTMACVHAAVNRRHRLFITTANLHFLSICQQDLAFRQTLRESDWCVADGMPLVWLSRLLGAGLQARVTGSDLFEKLSQEPVASGQLPIKVYFYGGEPGAAQAACERLNVHSCGLVCVGYETPGFGCAEELSTDATLDKINAAQADFLVVALESRKAQHWIQRNRGRLTTPVIANLGAVINFQAGRVKRAPVWMQSAGLEWLWRIKEEPDLWRRYWLDLKVLVALLISTILPYAGWLAVRRMKRRLSAWVSRASEKTPWAALNLSADGQQATLSLFGAIEDSVPAQIVQQFHHALASQLPVALDMAGLEFFGPRLAGQLLRFKTAMQSSGRATVLTGISPTLRQLLIWNGIL